MTLTLEQIERRLQPGTTDRAFLAAAEAIDARAPARPGLVHRCLAKREDGVWPDRLRRADAAAPAAGRRGLHAGHAGARGDGDDRPGEPAHDPCAGAGVGHGPVGRNIGGRRRLSRRAPSGFPCAAPRGRVTANGRRP